MSRHRGTERGVVKVASSLLLASVGALLSAVGCSAGDPSLDTPVSLEEVGSIQQAFTCSLKGAGCPVDSTCGDWTCQQPLSSECTVKVGASDGSRCESTEGKGICVGSACCTGCIVKTKLGYECRPGTAAAACGGPGTECVNCVSAVSDKCTIGICIAEKFVCDKQVVADGRPCTDNSGICFKGECCTGCFANGVCQPGTDVKLCGVGGAEKCENCDDGNPCTDDICGSKGCEHPAVEAGTSCDSDSNLCNGTAKCDGTVCKTSPAVVCNDGNPCTTDTCAPMTGQCVYTNNTLSCSDGDVCTLNDKCSGGKCVGTGALVCNDNEECTADSCDKLQGCQYKAVANDTSCDDGNICSTGDRCVAGKCTATGGKSCDDKNPCTKDACADNICGPTPEPNGTPCVYDRCHINSECQAGQCTQGTPISCDDGNPCTKDSCDVTTGCKYENVDGGACSDGDLCTVDDKCSAGKCVGSDMDCSPIDDCHVAGTCNAKTGTCDDPRAPDDTECEDGAGKCVSGKCDVPTPVDGAGGEGGQGGQGGAGQGGSGEGGEGNTPAAGGEPTTPTGGKGGSGNDNEGGEAIDPSRVFQREPGGCSCEVPGSSRPTAGWLAGLGFAALVAARRRRQGAQVARR